MGKEECLFHGSSLKSTLRDTNKVEFLYKMVKGAYLSSPRSVFWKDALEFIEKRYKKIKD